MRQEARGGGAILCELVHPLRERQGFFLRSGIVHAILPPGEIQWVENTGNEPLVSPAIFDPARREEEQVLPGWPAAGREGRLGNDAGRRSAMKDGKKAGGKAGMVREWTCILLLCAACTAGGFAAGFLWANPGSEGVDRETLFQVSTFGALMEGDYHGRVAFSELRKHGDFGIGTFDALDGEMVAIGGRYFQVTADGLVHPVADGMETPFATVTFFEPDIVFAVPRADNLSDFTRQVREVLPSENRIYAVRVRGEFLHVLARSVPRQEEPYPRLADVVKNQSVFSFNGTRGVAAGFYMPEYASGLNVPGFHLHYITDDRMGGGHVLDLSAEGVTVELDETPRFTVVPGGDGGRGKQISPPVRGELERIEKSG